MSINDYQQFKGGTMKSEILLANYQPSRKQLTGRIGGRGVAWKTSAREVLFSRQMLNTWILVLLTLEASTKTLTKP